MHQAAAEADTEWGDLLSSVAEQLKTPLMIISRQAELSRLTGDHDILQPAILQVQADAALQLVDSYLLGLELLRSQSRLELEPVSVASTLVDVAHALSGYAQQYGVAVEVSVDGKFEPVMAHARGLRAALLSLGFGLIEAQTVPEGRDRRLLLAMHRAAGGITAGVYARHSTVSAGQWRIAQQLLGHSPQPCTALNGSTGAGLFVADTIFRGMESRLRVGVWQRQRGMAGTLLPSQQLRLV